MAADSDKRRSLMNVLHERGLHVREADNVPRAWEVLGAEPFDLVVPVEDVLSGPGKDLVSDVRAFDDATAVVVVVDSAERGRQALAAGAWDFFASPVDQDRLAVVVDHIGEALRLRERCSVLDRMMNGGAHLGGLLTGDPYMISVLDNVRRLARYRTPVLIVGERGTEHEEVARALHDLGRPDAPFVVTPAAALTVADLRAKQDAAGGGTLFVDDVTALAADVSAALTAAVEQANAGGDERRCRLVVGCRQAELPSAEPGDARAELFTLLAGVTITLSPLRERRGDAVLIARQLAAGIGRDRGRELALTRSVEEALLAYPWPGNVDELKTVIVTAATTATGPAIEASDLPGALAEHAGTAAQPSGFRRLRDLEIQHLRQVLEETHGNKSRAARILGLSRWALQRKLRKHGITLGGEEPGGPAEASDEA